MLLLETSQDANCPIKSIPNSAEIRMLTLAFRRMSLPMLAMVLTALTWTSCQAIGAFQTRPAFPVVESDDDPRLPPTIIPPNVSANAFIGRCGKGRVSDPQTHGCRGPGDIKDSHKMMIGMMLRLTKVARSRPSPDSAQRAPTN